MNRTVIGDVYLDSLGYRRYNIWYNELGLFLYVTIVLTLAYITLRCVKKERWPYYIALFHLFMHLFISFICFIYLFISFIWFIYLCIHNSLILLRCTLQGVYLRLSYQHEVIAVIFILNVRKWLLLCYYKD